MSEINRPVKVYADHEPGRDGRDLYDSNDDLIADFWHPIAVEAAACINLAPDLACALAELIRDEKRDDDDAQLIATREKCVGLLVKWHEANKS